MVNAVGVYARRANKGGGYSTNTWLGSSCLPTNIITITGGGMFSMAKRKLRMEG